MHKPTRSRGMRAGFEYFRNFEHDAQDFAQMARHVSQCQLVTGEKAVVIS